MATGIYSNFFVAGTGNVSASDAAATLNGTSFTVSSTQTPVIFEFAKYFDGGLKKYIFAFTGVPGTYGSGGTIVTVSMLELLSVQPFLPDDIARYSAMTKTAITIPSGGN